VQQDTDNDGIGDLCDINTVLPNGAIQQVSNGHPVCTTTVTVQDNDRDGYCAGVDVNDSDDSGVGAKPEYAAFDSWVCNNTIDDDGDWPGGPGTGIDTAGYGGSDPDSGCGDSDGDQVLDVLDNCPQDFNPTQLDTDFVETDGTTIGQQPFLRSDTQQPIGPPVELLGQPFLRSDKFGGDACDVDMDGDLLPNDNEPAGSCTGGGNAVTDVDCDNDNVEDLTDYVFSTMCVNNVDFTCPGSNCLNPMNANTDGDSFPDWRENQDNDALFTYGESLIHKAAYIAQQDYPANPCTGNTEPIINGDTDGDGNKNGLEGYLGTRTNVKCAATAGTNNEPPPDNHPLDFNDSRSTNTVDIGFYVSRLGKQYGQEGFDRRFDLSPTGAIMVINTVDVGVFVSALGSTCS
jgi:hypothetical protein